MLNFILQQVLLCSTICSTNKVEVVAQKRKRIEAILRNQTNVDFATVDRILKDFGFIPKQPRRGSSHYTYRNAETKQKITVARHKPINQCTVNEIIDLLDLEGWESNEDNR